MELTGDDLAGIVDLFGGMSRAQLRDGIVELAFKRGEDVEPTAYDPEIDAAIEQYQLVPLEVDEQSTEPLLVAGPAAFPTAPEGARDLRHILEIEPREIDREIAGQAAASRLRQDVSDALAEKDSDRADELIEISYDIEAWAPVDLSAVRERLGS